MKSLVTLLALLFLAVPCAAAPQSAGGEAKALASFKKAFHPKKAAPVPARQQALTSLASFGSAKVAEALVKAHADVETEIAELAVLRNEHIAEIAQLEKGQEFKEQRTFPQAVIDRLNELKPRLARQRQELDDLRKLGNDLRAQIGALRDPESVRWLVQNVLGSKKYTLLLKLTVSEVAGSLSGELVKDLQRVFQRAKRPEELIALLKGMSFAGKEARAVAPQIIKLLEHKDEVVREHAAFALSKLAVPEAIEPMIDLLERETGRAKEHVASALEILTRQKHGVLIASWRRWYADEKERLFEPDAPLGGGMFERSESKSDSGYYFDIAMDGKSILYIIDASGSMKEEIELVLKDSKGEPKKDTRLAACKAELMSALTRLESDAEFNVMWYADIPRLFQDKMVKADKGNVTEGRAFVEKLVPNGYTNIYDSMKLAFELAGQGAKDRYYATGLDTIFLLTDGSPTTSDGKQDSTEKIIEAVREWNVLGRIKIHAIGIGKNINTAFLQQLASENGGEFRQY
ncbi:MAG: VWA domain-containing protein [Planctomycetes bacterium]|nr:VWA domain-containing protein [Planctomycetota bacterium]